ncbi:hypothetical protein L484_027333 [Morus notabilis]|uniref:Uncharacterized protein n=1 Tax=Morus notabilis TaxID=981085 RepID=W9QSA4_9ROSA|nr:hypothetical protein L484_027333 [Morus notabilis]
MEINKPPPPPSCWTQPSNSSGMPHHRRSSPPILTPPVLIILLPIITFLFLLSAVPPFLSFTSLIFRPIAVKKSWDLLNIFLVLFAILCGIFARRNDDESANNDVVPTARRSGGVEESEPANPQRWFAFSDDRRSEKIYDSVDRTAESGSLRRLRRSSSSYPDLRQESLWETGDDPRFQFRFFDDFEINKYRVTAPFDPSREIRGRRREADDGEAKEILVDTFVVRPTTPPKSPSPSPSPATPSPPPPPPPVERHKPRRTYRAVGERKEKAEKKQDDHNDADQFAKVRPPPPTPPPPPPRPPPSPARVRPEQRHVKLERRKSNVKKEIAMAFTSLYNQRKRKKKQKIASSGSHAHDSATSSPPEKTRFPPPSPPPPPPPLPPPPSSVFHNLFKKGIKSKRIHTIPPPPPPPPPPFSSSPPPSSRPSKHKNRSVPPPAPPTPPPISSSLRHSKHKNRSTPPPEPPTPPPPPATDRSRFGRRPPLPARSVNYYGENVNSGRPRPPIAAARVR